MRLMSLSEQDVVGLSVQNVASCCMKIGLL